MRHKIFLVVAEVFSGLIVFASFLAFTVLLWALLLPEPPA